MYRLKKKKKKKPKQKNPKKHFKWKLPEQGTQNIPIVRVKLIVCK